MTSRRAFSVATPHGVTLSLRRVSAKGGTPKARPVLVVPGYGMNSFVIGFHPTGRSLEESLAARGLEVWTVDMRGQGQSSRGPSDDVSLGDLAIDDLGPAIDRVLEETEVEGARTVDLVGCSLGAALAFAHVAIVERPKVSAIVSMGGLVTWRKVHPLVEVAFASPWLAGQVKLAGTRAMARLALPALARLAPGLLSIYINPKSTDISKASELVKTVEDPVASLNREIAEWVGRRELVVRGVNVSRAMSRLTLPVMCVLGRQDGVVPAETSRAIYEDVGSERRTLLEVGTAEWPIGHADLFVAEHAEDRIFAKVAEFLLDEASRDEPTLTP